MAVLILKSIRITWFLFQDFFEDFLDYSWYQRGCMMGMPS